jgi:Raf kinase inhibitor-like YbhB/YbcL family protein
VRRAALLIALLVLSACGGGEAEAPAPSVAGFEFDADGSAVSSGAAIDPRYTCDGEDVSPALAWGGVPDGARELALVVDDPDADGFTHWLVYGMPPAATSLPERIPPEGRVAGPTPLRQGENDFEHTGWGGPCPPRGDAHRYVFRLLALDAELALEPGSDRGAFDDALGDHVIAETRLEATYERAG